MCTDSSSVRTAYRVPPGETAAGPRPFSRGDLLFSRVCDRSQSVTPSWPFAPAAIIAPSGENASPSTFPLFPSRSASWAPEATSQTTTDPPPLTRYRPDGEKATFVSSP